MRTLPFSREVLIERDDFREDPPKKYFRLAPGREVRLKHAYLIRCENVVRDEASGEISELHCTYDPASRGGDAPDGRKVRGTLHWVSASHAVEAEVRLFDHLLLEAPPDAGAELADLVNPHSLDVLKGSVVEPGLAEAAPGSIFQFLRHGYFCADSVDSRTGSPVFNRSVSLRDTWAKIEKARGKS